ncbi:hypothetical protein E9549_22710, partial [Blastococcus sp. MG754426]|nr:hypothetical protein [Blastococcus sp. MG754426]
HPLHDQQERDQQRGEEDDTEGDQSRSPLHRRRDGGEAVRPRSWHARRGSAGPPTLDRVSAPASSPAYARPTRARRRCRGDRDWSPSVSSSSPRC